MEVICGLRKWYIDRQKKRGKKKDAAQDRKTISDVRPVALLPQDGSVPARVAHTIAPCWRWWWSYRINKRERMARASEINAK